MSLTYREIAEILKVIDASDCDEIVLELEGVRLVVRRRGGARVEELSGISPASDPPPQGARARTDKPETGGEAGEPEETAEASSRVETRADGCIEIRAPMVGTFYRSPSPDEPPFVEVGDRVERGTALCLIEVMKLFTTVESTLDGRVVAIPVEDATLVEFGQTLFVIEPEETR
jgi:acetyl-CoA carboxylase biotin carboxyl carrier protein